MMSQRPGDMVFVAESGGIEEYRMANGMKVLLSEQRAAPVVAFMVLYHVGSRNEAVGYTGATHLLEHMLFKGTPTFNARRGTAIATVLHRIGAVFNATTWFDRTNYYEAVPREHLELVMRLEADRMRNALILDEDREQERIVVRNELERGENDPLNVLEIHTVRSAKGRPHEGPPAPAEASGTSGLKNAGRWSEDSLPSSATTAAPPTTFFGTNHPTVRLSS